MKSLPHSLAVFSALLIAALWLSSCTPAAVPPAGIPTSTPPPSKNLEVTPMGTNANQEHLPLIYFTRSGGIVGFCDEVTIFNDGFAQIASCRKNTGAQVALSAGQKAKIDLWQTNLAGFRSDQGNGTVPDGMTIHLVFSGNGKGSVSSADQEAMQAMAIELIQAVVR